MAESAGAKISIKLRWLLSQRPRREVTYTMGLAFPGGRAGTAN